MQGQYVGTRRSILGDLHLTAEELRVPAARQSVGAQLSWRSWYVLALLVADVVAAIGAWVFSYVVRGSVKEIQVVALSIPLHLLVALSLPIWLLTMYCAGAYRPGVLADGFREYRIAVVIGLRSMAVVAIASFVLKSSVSRLLVIVYFPSLILLAVIGRFAVRQGLARLRVAGRAQVRLLVVGDVPSAQRFASHLYRNKTLGYQVVGACLPPDSGPLAFRGAIIPALGTPDAALGVAQLAGVDAVAVANPNNFEDLTLQKLAWSLERSGIDLLVAPDVADVAGPRIRIAPVTGLPLLHITEPRVDSLARQVVSLGSRLLAIPLTLILSPVLVLVALAVLIDSGRPLFYRQERIGHREKPFRILKFRTMVPDADDQLAQIIHLNEHDGALFKIRNDPRVTRVGKWLRKFSLDELPQLFNVLKGDMVFVGPRPVLEREMSQFGEAEQRRFLTKPGMTGLWQVSGRTDIPWEDAVKLDLYYVENWSPLLDLLIMCRTIRIVLAGTGA